jgi:predicted MPP superfamily phosphohydrolase
MWHEIARGALAAAVIGSGALVYAWQIERRWLRISFHQTPVDGLPAAWDGLRIVQLSDLHLGAWGTPYGLLRRAVAETVRLRPDLIVLTGDFSNNGWPHPFDLLAPLARTAPTVAILGNHDYFARRADIIAGLLAAEGIVVLRNAAWRFTHGGASGIIAGFDDALSGPGARVEQMVTDLAPERPLLALIHSPDVIERFPRAWAGVTLAGHTHGAQVRLSPLRQVDWIRWSRDNKRSKYPRGWFEVRGNRLYVSHGLGVSGLPLRLGARPELACFELRPAQVACGQSRAERQAQDTAKVHLASDM